MNNLVKNVWDYSLLETTRNLCRVILKAQPKKNDWNGLTLPRLDLIFAGPPPTPDPTYWIRICSHLKFSRVARTMIQGITHRNGAPVTRSDEIKHRKRNSERKIKVKQNRSKKVTAKVNGLFCLSFLLRFFLCFFFAFVFSFFVCPV